MAKRGNIHPQFMAGAEYAMSELLKAVRFNPDAHRALRVAMTQVKGELAKANAKVEHTPQGMGTRMPMNKRNGVADSHYL